MRPNNWSDMDMLRALDWIDHEGLTRSQRSEPASADRRTA